MALTVEQLKELYQLIFVGNPTHLEELTDCLQRCGPDNWDAARDKIAELIPNADPNEDSQLACLKKILCGSKLAPLRPDFYRKIVQDNQYPKLVEVQREMYDHYGIQSQIRLDDIAEKLIAILEDPPGTWTEQRLDALYELLIRDIRFKTVAPYGVSTSCW